MALTQRDSALENKISREMKLAAKAEDIKAEKLRQLIAEGKAVIPANRLHKNLQPIGIGAGLKTKVNANIGSSPDKASLQAELKKLKVCLEAKADTVMDLSTGGNIQKIRQEMIKNCPVPLGTVPIYEAVVQKKEVIDLNANDFFKVIERHCQDGVDFITVHCGLTKKAFPATKKRLMPVVSRGGAFLSAWMSHHKRENPLFEDFDRLLKIAKKYDVTLSLGDGLRPGCLADATDKAQLHELKVLGELTKRAWQEGVQVIVEGPGHIPLHEIERNMRLQKKYCHGAPFYVLGPLVSDVAPGYDHITSAIGGTLAAFYGADFLCYVSPAEHLGLPNAAEVREGIMASRIAAHAADIAKGIKGARQWDDQMSKARKELDWKEMAKQALDPSKVKGMKDCQPGKECSMCGKYCSVKLSKKVF